MSSSSIGVKLVKESVFINGGLGSFSLFFGFKQLQLLKNKMKMVNMVILLIFIYVISKIVYIIPIIVV